MPSYLGVPACGLAAFAALRLAHVPWTAVAALALIVGAFAPLPGAALLGGAVLAAHAGRPRTGTSGPRIVIGIDEHRQPVAISLGGERGSHALIVGATGSGEHVLPPLLKSPYDPETQNHGRLRPRVPCDGPCRRVVPVARPAASSDHRVGRIAWNRHRGVASGPRPVRRHACPSSARRVLGANQIRRDGRNRRRSSGPTLAGGCRRHALKLIEEIHHAGGEIAALDLGFDSTTTVGRFVWTLMLGFTQMERERITASWATATSNAVARGVPIGNAPFGYVKDTDGRFVADPQQGPVVTRVFELAAQGDHRAALARFQEHDGLSATTSLWHLRRFLDNRVYLGEVHYGEQATPDSHPALTTKAVWTAAQMADARPQRETAVYPLSGSRSARAAART